MSGWLVVRSDPGAVLDPAAWTRALASVPGQAQQTWTSPDGELRVASWRRETGEFRRSGLLHQDAAADACVAWVGVCLEDDGDKSDEAVAILGAAGDAGSRAAGLNGSFAAAAIQISTGRLRLWTDRHRHYPVYYWRGGGLLAASTEISCVMPFLSRPKPDLRAIDLFFRVGEFTGGRTPVEGLEVLPPGSELQAERGGEPSVRIYWKLRHRGEKALGFEEAATGLASRLTTAVRRVESAYPRLITPLSGGLDSRLILGLCRNPEKVPSVTWGEPGCRDIEYAEAFAARVGSPHRTLPFDPGAFVPRWGDGVAATGGCFPVRDMFLLPFTPGLAEKGDVALNGLAGDVFLGGNFLKNSWMGIDRLQDLAGETWRWRVSAEEETLTSTLMSEPVKPEEARESWIRSITSHGDGLPIEVLVDWLLENRIFRFTNCGTLLLRMSLDSYSPFFDRDVVDFLVRVPMSYRVKHRLYLRVLSKASPAAAEIPWQRTAIAPKWGHPAALASMAWHRVMRGLGKRLGFVAFPGEQVASPADWLRGPWAAPVKDLLFSERALARKIVNPDSLRRLWDAHQGGRDLSRALGALVAVELFSLRFLDRLPDPRGGGPA